MLLDSGPVGCVSSVPGYPSMPTQPPFERIDRGGVREIVRRGTPVETRIDEPSAG